MAVLGDMLIDVWVIALRVTSFAARFLVAFAIVTWIIASH
jgi:hypothetical protein